MANDSATAVNEKLLDQTMAEPKATPTRVNNPNKCVIKSQDMPSEMSKTAIEVAVMVSFMS